MDDVEGSFRHQGRGPNQLVISAMFCDDLSVVIPSSVILNLKHKFGIDFSVWIQNACCVLFFVELIAQSHQEDELGALAVLWQTDDVAIKNFRDLFGYVQAKANAFGVDLLGGIQEAEHLE